MGGADLDRSATPDQPRLNLDQDGILLGSQLFDEVAVHVDFTRMTVTPANGPTRSADTEICCRRPATQAALIAAITLSEGSAKAFVPFILARCNRTNTRQYSLVSYRHPSLDNEAA